MKCCKSDLFTGLFKVSSKHKEEAGQNGLELVRPADKSFGEGYQNYKLYEYKSCKHREYLQPTHVRRGNVQCKICLELQYEQQAAEVGLKIIGGGSTVYHRTYLNQECGHILDVRLSSIKGTLKSDDCKRRCPICYEERLHLDALKQDMTYLGEPIEKSGVFRRYKFNACGHVRDVNAACVARGAVDCQDCKVDGYAKDAERVGITYNGLSTVNDSIKRNYILKCGHRKDLRMDHVRNGSWACDYCGDTHYTKPSKIYLLKIKDGDFEWLKLGYAKNVKLRSNGYGLSKTAKINVLFVDDVSTGINALHIEKAIHLKFKPRRIDSKLMSSYHKHNGHTECYYTDVEHCMLNELRTKLKEVNGDKEKQDQ